MFLKFKETPNYKKLRFTLISAILDLNKVPSKEYDWNNYQDDHTRFRVSNGSYDEARMQKVDELK